MVLRKTKYFELLMVIANHITDLLSTLIITKLLSIHLTKVDYGFYALILSILAFVTILPFSSLHTAIERFIAEYKGKSNYADYLFPLISIHLIFFGVYLILSPIIYINIDHVWKSIFIPLILFIFTRIYKILLLCVLNVERERLVMLISRIIDMIVQIIIITYYIYNSALTVEIIILSATLANFVSISILFSVLKNNISFKGFWANAPFVLNYVLKYSLPLIMWGIFLWAQNMIIRWYVEFYMTKEDVANFSIMTSLALLPASAIISIVGQFIVPISYNKEAIQSGTIAAINKKLFGYVSGLMVLGIIGAYFLKDDLILLFLDKKYIDVSWSLPLLMIGTSIYAIGQVLIYEIYYYKRPSILIASNIIPGIFSLITGMFFIKLWGYSGAILTNIISFTLSGVITLLTVLYFTRKKAPLLYLTK